MATEHASKRQKLNNGSTSSNLDIFTSDIFTLTIGPTKLVMTCHEGALCKSPVFAAMCNGSFQEATTKNILLPEESADTFRSLLRFLYVGNLGFLEEPDNVTEALQLLGQLYILGDRYELPDLQLCALNDLKHIHGRGNADTTEFCEVFRSMYENVGRVDADLREFYKDFVPVGTKPVATKDSSGAVTGCLESGGLLAVDTYKKLEASNDKAKEQLVQRTTEKRQLETSRQNLAQRLKDTKKQNEDDCKVLCTFLTLFLANSCTGISMSPQVDAIVAFMETHCGVAPTSSLVLNLRAARNQFYLTFGNRPPKF